LSALDDTPLSWKIDSRFACSLRMAFLNYGYAAQRCALCPEEVLVGKERTKNGK
jgi:hypothetical protein